MKLFWQQLLAILASLVLAGCAGQMNKDWGFRYEDREAIAEQASKVEALSVNLYDMARNPVYYTGQTDPKGVDGIRFLAGEAARFKRAAQAWKPGGSINIPYSNLLDRWSTMRNNAGTLTANSDIRKMIEQVNALMMDLGRFTANGGGHGPAVTGPTLAVPKPTPR